MMKRAAAGILLVSCSVISCRATVTGQQPDLYDPGQFRTFVLTFPSSEWFKQLEQTYPSAVYHKADLRVDNVTYRDVGVRFRGWKMYRLAPRKKPFKISMDAFAPGRKLYGYRTINLNNGGHDPTLAREVISSRIFARYCPAFKANHVRLEVNGENFGVYVNAQQVNEDFGKEWFQDAGGNRYRAEIKSGAPPDASAMTWLGPQPVAYTQGYDLKSESPSNPWADLAHACEMLNNTPPASLEQELPGVLSVDSALWMLAINNVLGNGDTYMWLAHNYYLYHDGVHGRFRFITWDLDLAFSTIWADKWTIDPFFMYGQPGRPLITRLLSRPRWRQAYLAHIRTLLQADFRWDVLEPRIRTVQTRIDAAVRTDPIKIYGYTAFKDNVTRTLSGRISGLKPFVETRRAFLLAHDDVKKPAPTVTRVAHDPLQPKRGETVWITCHVQGPSTIHSVHLGYRHRGPFVRVPMSDDGQHHDGQPGDGVYGVAIPPQPRGAVVDYFVEAALAPAAGGGMAFEPPSPERGARSFRVPSPVLINEFLADNDRGIRDERGEREDWIELTNVSSSPVDLGGLYLSDDAGDPTRWRIPAGTKLSPGASVLFWADGEPEEGPAHASFRLDKDGEAVVLVDADGATVLDAVDFGPQQEDVSQGRMAGRSGMWARFTQPTPWRPNRPEPCGHLPYAGVLGRPACTLSGHGPPDVGQDVTYRITGAPPATAGYLAVALAPGALAFGSRGSLLIDLSALVMNLLRLTDASGSAQLTLRIPNDRRLSGLSLYVQAAFATATAGGFSNAVLTRICP